MLNVNYLYSGSTFVILYELFCLVLGDMTAESQQLTFAPESGNMLGGTIVNITGPCFDRDHSITCRLLF